MFILVTGGAASGKSEFAEDITAGSGYSKKIYIATMKPFDEETLLRIKKHHDMRRNKGFETYEVYGYLAESCLKEEYGFSSSAVIFECMSNYLNNILFDAEYKVSDVDCIKDKIIKDLNDFISICPYLTIVTNEIFSDGEMYSEEVTRYINVLGNLNSILADMADVVYEVVCGIPVCIKGGGF